VALANQPRLAADLVADDPAGAVELLEQSRADVRETVQQLRDLAHGIYPTLLADAGLGPALLAAAVRFPSPITVDLPELRPGTDTDAQTDAALYFCVLEALQNAAKHAPGAEVRITGRCRGGVLLIEVADDGPGMTSDGGSDGQGRQNMRDRLGAVGGTVAWRSAPGAGTTVALAVPLDSSSSAGG
jgi:signal transduction histidine kinase